MMRTDRKRISVGTELLLLVAILMVTLPLAWTMFLAFQPNRSIVRRNWDIDLWLGNFQELFRPGSTFLQQTFNSLSITAGSVVICLVVGSLAGYGLSKLAPPRWIMLPSIALAILIPLIPPITLVPGMVVQMSSFGLLGTTTSLVLLNTVFNLPFATLLMKSNFDNVPDELREAALVDGASEARTFLSIVLPLVRPGLAAVGIFVAIMAWNEFLFGLTMTSGGETAPLTVGIASLVQPFEVTWGQMAAAGTVAAVPIIILAIFANRQIVAGLSSGAVKG
jgi:ABC-type glycerol-3-phosphate transport system permease component